MSAFQWWAVPIDNPDGATPFDDAALPLMQQYADNPEKGLRLERREKPNGAAGAAVVSAPLPEPSAAPAPATEGYTVFPTQSAQKMDFFECDWAGFVAMLKDPPRSADKATLPWLKLAKFDGSRTPLVDAGDGKKTGNCLRHDAGVETVYGVELDYDAGALSFDDAVFKLDAAGVKCVVVTSPRYTPEKPKLRVFAPLSVPVERGTKWSAEEIAAAKGTPFASLMEDRNARDDTAYMKSYRRLCTELLAAFIGTEHEPDKISFNLSQSFYYGNVDGHEYRVQEVEGEFIDVVPWPTGFAGSSPETQHVNADALNQAPVMPPDWGKTRSVSTEESELVEKLLSGEEYHDPEMKLAAKYAARGMPEQNAVDLITVLHDYAEQRDGWEARRAEIARTVRTGYAKFYKEPTPDADRPTGGVDHDGDYLIHDIDWDVLDVSGDPPPRRWVWSQYIPVAHVTSLYGKGAVGKTLLAQQLVTAMQFDEKLFGSAVSRGRVLALYCEDDGEELWRRQMNLMPEGRRLTELKDRAVSEARVGRNNVLLTVDPRNKQLVVATKFYEHLNSMLAGAQALGQGYSLLILDNISQMCAVPENDRPLVTQAVNLLARLAKEHDLGLLLLGHTAKVEGSQFSGSTAWENVVRSRLLLERKNDKPDSPLILKRAKANYAGQDEVELRYDRGRFVQIDAFKKADERRSESDMLLGLVRKAQERRLDISASRMSPQSAYNVLKAFEDFPGLSSKEVGDWVQRELAAGRLKVEVIQTAQRKSKEVLRLVGEAQGEPAW